MSTHEDDGLGDYPRGAGSLFVALVFAFMLGLLFVVLVEYVWSRWR